MYYVYVHRDKEGKTFYVGKGKDKRAYSTWRSEEWLGKVEKEGEYTVEIIAADLKEHEALMIERSVVKALVPNILNEAIPASVVLAKDFERKKKEEKRKAHLEKRVKENEKKIQALQKQLSELELTPEEETFMNSPLALAPSKYLTDQQQQFRSKLTDKVRKRTKIISQMETI